MKIRRAPHPANARQGLVVGGGGRLGGDLLGRDVWRLWVRDNRTTSRDSLYYRQRISFPCSHEGCVIAQKPPRYRLTDAKVAGGRRERNQLSFHVDSSIRVCVS